MAVPEYRSHSGTRYFIAVALLIYAGYLIRHTAFSVAGSDASGYLNAAHLLSERRLKVRVTPLDTLHLDNSWRVVFLPLGFAQPDEPKVVVPSYPLGYPLHLLVFGAIGGWNHAPFYVTPLAALLTVLVLYKLGREFDLPEELAICAAAVLAISPGWLFQSFQAMSDVLAAMWCSIAIFFAVRGQRDARWAIACGAAFAIAVWVRPSNLLLAPAIGFALRWNVRRLAAAVAASVPFAIALMLTNKSMYGKALVTGYGGVGDLMTWGACGPHYIKWLAFTLTPIVFPCGLLVAFHRRMPLWQRMTLLSWFVAFLAFYSSYAICDAWWYLRFLLPAYAPILLASFVLIRDFVSRRAIQMALAAIMLITAIGFDRHFDVGAFFESAKTDMHAVHWAQKQLPPDALVVTMQMSGSYYYYTQRFAARYDYIAPPRFEELRAYVGDAGLKWYALVYDWEEERLTKQMPGRWVRLNQMRNVYLLRLAD